MTILLTLIISALTPWILETAKVYTFSDAVLSDYTQEDSSYVRTLKVTSSHQNTAVGGFQVGCRADVGNQVLKVNSQINVYYDC